MSAVVRVGLDGSLREGDLPPIQGAVVAMHTAMYADRPDVGCVLHTHSPYATAYAVAQRPIGCWLEALAMFGLPTGVPVAGYGPRGSEESLIENISEVLGSGPNDGELVSYGDGGIIGGRYDITGAWIEDHSPEVRHELNYIGVSPDLKALAKSCLVEGISYWEPQEHELFDVDSPYLLADNPEDVDYVLGAACDAVTVRLNGTVVRDVLPEIQ